MSPASIPHLHEVGLGGTLSNQACVNTSCLQPCCITDLHTCRVFSTHSQGDSIPVWSLPVCLNRETSKAAVGTLNPKTLSPGRYSRASTRGEQYSQYTVGTRTQGTSRKLRRNLQRRQASLCCFIGCIGLTDIGNRMVGKVPSKDVGHHNRNTLGVQRPVVTTVVQGWRACNATSALRHLLAWRASKVLHAC